MYNKCRFYFFSKENKIKMKRSAVKITLLLTMTVQHVTENEFTSRC